MVPENWKVRMEMLRRLARANVRGEGPPSVREVGEAVGLRSSQTAYKHLKKLEEGGYIEREGGRAPAWYQADGEGLGGSGRDALVG